MTGLTFRTPALLGRSTFDQIFDQFFNDPVLIKQSTTGYPLTDIYKDESSNQIIEMALAGFTKDELCVEVKENTINISADNKLSNAGGAHERRIARRSFKKTFVDYHNQLDFGNTTVTFENGLLRISIPPQQETKAVEITIA